MDNFAQCLTFVKSHEENYTVNEIPTKAIKVKSEENIVNEIPTKPIVEINFWKTDHHEEKFWNAHETCTRGIPMVLILNWLKNKKGKTFLTIASRRTLIKSQSIGNVTGVAAAWNWAFKMQLREYSLEAGSIWSNFDNYQSVFLKKKELKGRLKPAGEYKSITKKKIEREVEIICFHLHRPKESYACARVHVLNEAKKIYGKEVEASHKVAFLDASKKLDLENWILEKIIHCSQVSYHHRRLRAFLAIAEAIEMRVPPHVPDIIQKGILQNWQYPKKHRY